MKRASRSARSRRASLTIGCFLLVPKLETFLDALETFVRDGRALVIFSGDHVEPAAYNETFGNLPAFEAQGIKMEHGWDTHAPMGWPEDWLDPKAGKLGDASKYWKFSVDEATNLVRLLSFSPYSPFSLAYGQ